MKIVVTITDEALRANLAGFPSRLTANLEHALDRFSKILQTQVKEKLSDDVLHVRTGTLRRSINQEVRTDPGGTEAIVGTNVEYAAVHEYGFHGEVSVREHLRRILGARPTAAGQSRVSRDGRTRFVVGSTTVRAHMRNVNLPERSFLRSALHELESLAVSEIQRAAKNAIEGTDA